MESKTGNQDQVSAAISRLKEIACVSLDEAAIIARNAATKRLEVEDPAIRGELMGKLRDAITPEGISIISPLNKIDALMRLGIEVVMAEAMREVQWMAPYLMYMADVLKIARKAELGEQVSDIDLDVLDPYGYIRAVDEHESEDDRYIAAHLIELIKNIPVEYEVYVDEFIDDIFYDLELAVMNVFAIFAHIGFDPNTIMSDFMKEIFRNSIPGTEQKS